MAENRIRAALLTGVDMGGEWTVNTDSGANGGTTDCPAFDELNRATEQAPDVAFLKGPIGQIGHYVGEAIISRSAAEARATFGEFAGLAQRCASITVTPSDGQPTFRITVAPLEFPRLGDESVALRLTATKQNVAVVQEHVLIRRGGLLIVVLNVTRSGSMDSSFTQSVCRKALDKVVRALG